MSKSATAARLSGMGPDLLPGRLEQRLGERVKPRARACPADALQADAGPFDQQEQLVSHVLGLSIARLAAELHHALAAAPLVRLDDLARGMAGGRELDRGVGERAAAP